MLFNKKRPAKVNKIVFEAYRSAINKRMKAGKDVNLMVDRLNCLIKSK